MTWLTAGTVDATAGPGWAGLWSVLFTAERAVMALVQATSFAQALDLVWLAEELRDAFDDVQATHPAEVSNTTALDLGPVGPPEHLDAARQITAELLSATIRRSDELAAATSDPPTLLWLSGLGTSLFAARLRVVGAGVR